MHNTTIKKFGAHISAGEVRSPKNFEQTKKESDKLVPVLFSDLRMSIEAAGKKLPVRFTYVEVDELSIRSLKICLRNKNNVFLNRSKEDYIFEILPDGTKVSTKLNLLIGKRSSGKTFTLNQIIKSFSMRNENSIKYIKQFQLTNESTDEEFELGIKRRQENFVEEYFRPIKNLITEVSRIKDYDNNGVEQYLDSLKAYAQQDFLEDVYSKQKVYSEVKFDSLKPNELEKLINAVIIIITNSKYKPIIHGFLEYDKLIGLRKTLIDRYKSETLEHSLKETIDSILNDLKKKLSISSSKKPIQDFNFYETFKQTEIVARFNKTINELKSKSILREVEFNRFKLIVEKRVFNNAREVKNELKATAALAAIFNEYYKTPFTYINELMEIGIPEGSLYKALFKMEYKVVNYKGTPISGGERAEFNLLDNIDEARNYDVLLLDEPEASFDNIFIKESIIPKLNEISQNVTVFVVTHNSTLGTLINPTYILYNDFDEESYLAGQKMRDQCFRIYTGSFSSRELTTSTGEKMENFLALINTMEAGEDAYNERRGLYETFKN